MRIVIAADHGGFRLKNEIALLLRQDGHTVEDLGTNDEAACDYPDYAHAVARSVVDDRADRGILLCGTGVGMSITANRHAGVRAVVCSDVYTAKLSRSHNDANVLCIGGRVVGGGLGWQIVTAWLEEPASTEPRHQTRRKKIEL